MLKQLNDWAVDNLIGSPDSTGCVGSGIVPADWSDGVDNVTRCLVTIQVEL